MALNVHGSVERTNVGDQADADVSGDGANADDAPYACRGCAMMIVYISTLE